jgi:hypothetical protein
LALIVRESSSGEKVIKNGKRMRLGANYFQNLRIKKKILLFVFVCQCLSKKLTEIHLNRVINHLTRNLRRKWADKVNVDVILTKTLKMPGIFHSFSYYYVPLWAESQIFASKCIFYLHWFRFLVYRSAEIWAAAMSLCSSYLMTFFWGPLEKIGLEKTLLKKHSWYGMSVKMS